MALAQYTDLIAAISDWTMRNSDAALSTRSPDFVTLCEARYNRALRLRNMEDRATADVSTQYVALPDGFLEMRNFQLNTEPVQALDMVSPEFIDKTFGSTSTGKPKVFAIVRNEIQLAPIPDGTYQAEMAFWKKFDALSGSNATNWLLTNAPDVYLWGSLAEAAQWLSQWDDFAKFDARYQQAVKSLQDSDDRGKWNGSSINVRVVDQWTP